MGRPRKFLSVLVRTSCQLLVPLVALDHRLEQELADAAPLFTIKFDALEKLCILTLREVALCLLDIVTVVFASHSFLQQGSLCAFHHGIGLG